MRRRAGVVGGMILRGLLWGRRAGRREEEEERERREREFDRDVSWFVEREVVVVEEGVSVVVVGRRRIVVNALLAALATDTLDTDLTE